MHAIDSCNSAFEREFRHRALHHLLAALYVYTGEIVHTAQRKQLAHVLVDTVTRLNAQMPKAASERPIQRVNWALPDLAQHRLGNAYSAAE